MPKTVPFLSNFPILIFIKPILGCKPGHDVINSPVHPWGPSQ